MQGLSMLTLTIAAILLFLAGVIYGYAQSVDGAVQRKFCNKHSGATFTEITRYENESVVLREDVGVRLLVPHTELEKHYEVVK